MQASEVKSVGGRKWCAPKMNGWDENINFAIYLSTFHIPSLAAQNPSP